MTVFSAESLVSKESLSIESDMDDDNSIPIRLQNEIIEDDESDYDEGDFNDIEINSLPSSPSNDETRDINTNDHENSDSKQDQTRVDKDDKEETEDSSVKPTHSYIALIAMAILSSPSKKMILGDIYQYIQDNYPYYRNKDKSWRNSIRHNLSLNECFIKAGRSENGKGNYWGIHPVNMDDFANGDFRRRRARRRVRKTAALKFGGLAGYGFSPFSSHTPIMSYRADRFCPYPIPCHSHVSCTKNFAIESILSPQENSQLYSAQAHRPLHLPPFHLPASNSHSYSSIALNVPAPNGVPAIISPLSSYTSISTHRLSPYNTGCSASAPTESWQETLEKLQAQFRKSAKTTQHS